MGHDISPIGSHTLDLTDLQSLAKDLHHRLNINIKYGAYILEDHAKLLDLDLRKVKGFYVLGKFIDDPSKPVYTLFDEDYIDKQLLEKYGPGIFESEAYDIYDCGTLNKQEAEEIAEDLNFANYSLEYNGPRGFEYLFVYNHLYENNLFYYSRWFGFCSFFKNFNFKNENYLKNFNEFRLNNARIAKKLGGNDLFYLDDQSSELSDIGLGQTNIIGTWIRPKPMFTKKPALPCSTFPRF